MATATIGGLREQVRGEIVTPDDKAYDEARKVYNAMIDRRPRVIVRPRGTEDVVAAVNFARESDAPVAVRGGGHSVPGFGTGDDAVVIDLCRSPLAQITKWARPASRLNRQLSWPQAGQA